MPTKSFITENYEKHVSGKQVKFVKKCLGLSSQESISKHRRTEAELDVLEKELRVGTYHRDNVNGYVIPLDMEDKVVYGNSQKIAIIDYCIKTLPINRRLLDVEESFIATSNLTEEELQRLESELGL